MLLAWALSCALMVAPGSAPAGSEAGAESRTEAQILFDEGQAKYATHDYAGAIEDFTAAYALGQEIGDPALREQVLARLAFNLARAHVSAYDVDTDLSHLTLARRLLADYRGYERSRGRDPDADTDVERLERELTERERQLDEAGSPTEPEPKPEPEPAQSKGRARVQLRAGIALLALTPAFVGLAAGGAALGVRARAGFEAATTGDGRLDARRRGRAGDALLGVGIGLAAASAVVGVTLIVVSRRGEEAPQLGFGLRPGGVVVEGRF